MHATFLSKSAASARNIGLVAAAVIGAAALASAAAMLGPPQRAASPSSAGPERGAAAIAPVGVAGESIIAGDPSVPSAASVFAGSSAAPNAQPDTF